MSKKQFMLAPGRQILTEIRGGFGAHGVTSVTAMHGRVCAWGAGGLQCHGESDSLCVCAGLHGFVGILMGVGGS